MIKKIILICLLTLIISLLVGCTTQEELQKCQKLCIDNNMTYRTTDVSGIGNDYVSCTCYIIETRENWRDEK